MQKAIVLKAATVFVFAGALYACGNTASSDKKGSAATTPAERIKRGEYLVNVIGCDDCHSPKRMGAHGPEIIAEQRLGGYPANRPITKPDATDLTKGYVLLGGDLTLAVGPWGVSFSSNISSDETGIGNWTEQAFLNAMRHGKIKGLDNGRNMLPPMPWYNLAKLSDDDLKAMFAYLKSTPPVANVVPQPRQLADLK